MTLKDLIDTLMLDCDEDSTDLTMVSRFKNYINRGYKELAVRENLEKVIEKTLVDNYFTVPDDFVKISDLKVDNISVPYAIQGKTVYVKTTSTNPVSLIYNYLPDTLIRDTDELETNAANVEFVINYAKWLYFLNDGLIEEANLFKLEYEKLALIRNDIKLVDFVDVFGGFLNV